MKLTAAGLLISLGFHAAVLGLLPGLQRRPQYTDTAMPGIAPLSTLAVRFASVPVPENTGDRNESAPAAVASPVESDADSPLPAVSEAAAVEAESAVPPEPAEQTADQTAERTAERTAKAAMEAGISAGEEADSSVSDHAAPATASVSSRERTEPVPLEPINPEYPMMARRMGLEGTVVLVLTIDENGKPIGHEFVDPRAHRLLENAAVETAMSAAYKPGTRNSSPISDTLRLRIVFRLET